MPADSDGVSKKVLKSLEEILFWLKIENIDKAHEYFKRVLDSEQKRQVYRMSDGKNSIEEIMNATGIKSKSTISSWWTDWLAKGIVRKSTEHAGRKEKVIELIEIGL